MKIRYSIDKYNHSYQRNMPHRWTQQGVAEVIEDGSYDIFHLEAYPSNNFIVLSLFAKENRIIYKTRSIGPSTIDALQSIALDFHEPQLWFLHLIYKTYPETNNAIEFYLKHSYDVKERFKWGNLTDELKTFVMSAVLGEGTYETQVQLK